MALFNIGRKTKSGYPETNYIYTQADTYRGYKRIKLSSYGYKPAQDGIKAVSRMDLSGADIKIVVCDKPDSPYALVLVGKHHVGTIFKNSFDKFNDLKNGKVDSIRLEIRDGDAYLFYHIA